MTSGAKTTLTATITLLSIGLCILYSTSAPIYGDILLKKQLIYISAGSLAGVTCYYLGWERLIRWRFWIAALVIAPLIWLAVSMSISSIGGSPLPLTRNIKGAYRWIVLGPISIQPSEVAKVSLALILAGHFKVKRVGWIENFLKPAGYIIAMLTLIGAGKSMSVTVLTAAMAGFTLFLAGANKRALSISLVLAVMLGCIIISKSPVRKKRIMAFRSPELYKEKESFQLLASLKALGSGGVTGTGFSASRMKNRYLPEAHTDFILSVVGEELGFIGILTILSMYVVFLLGSASIAIRAKTIEARLLAAACGINICLHALCNAAVVSGSAPTTGVTAPFISYGGSSIVAGLINVGILISIGKTKPNIESDTVEASAHK